MSKAWLKLTWHDQRVCTIAGFANLFMSRWLACLLAKGTYSMPSRCINDAARLPCYWKKMRSRTSLTSNHLFDSGETILVVSPRVFYFLLSLFDIVLLLSDRSCPYFLCSLSHAVHRIFTDVTFTRKFCIILTFTWLEPNLRRSTCVSWQIFSENLQ